MAEALLPGLPDEIVIWEILVRLPPKSLLRCRAVCRAWRRTTSTRAFLLAHHGRQPSLPVVCGFDGYNQSILAFDHRAAADAWLRPVARLDGERFFCLQASCDGLLVFSATTAAWRPCLAVCNPATRQSALLRHPRDASLFGVLGMYLHRPSGEYRLLLHRTSGRPAILGHDPLPERRTGCYVSALGSDQPPRYIGGPAAAASALGFYTPALVRDCLHWSPVGSCKVVTVFDTAAESFRQMRAPIAPTKLSIFQLDGKLGIYSNDNATKAVDVWVLPNYEGEVWEHKYRVELPAAEIRGQFGGRGGRLNVSVVSAGDAVLLLLICGQWLFYVDVDGVLVDSFSCDGQKLYACGLALKQTLVPHAFFTALEDYTVNASPFI
ncbi:F-box protein At5g49610-like [Lolium perenne]|uniref:F-box protein At5g49610-like n=1 Tax=Lolium perenne TaxID=4522 RepID=UPI0021EA83D0|nr:F-box protein At5g49610-like [Lolium perenne]